MDSKEYKKYTNNIPMNNLANYIIIYYEKSQNIILINQLFNSIKNIFTNSENINFYLYAYPTNYDKYSFGFKITKYFNTTIHPVLAIINALRQGYHVIYLQDTNMIKKIISDDWNIMSSNIKLSEAPNIYRKFMKKFALEYVNTFDIFCVKCSGENIKFLEYAYEIAKKLKFDKFISSDFAISYIKNNNIFDINNYAKIINSNQKFFRNIIFENLISIQDKFFLKSIHTTLIAGNKYIYYPFMDFDLDINAVPKKINGIKIISELPQVFNTNGIIYEYQDEIYYHLKPRFNNYNSGIFIFNRSNQSNIIPTIIHYIGNDKIGLENWERKLKYPWMLNHWNGETVENFIISTRWYKHYINAENNIIAEIILKIAIFENVGGFVVSNNVEILDDIDMPINYPIIFSFNKGNDINFDIFGMVSNTKYSNSKMNNTSQYINLIYDKLFGALENGIGNYVIEFSKILTHNKYCFIYPNYYFNITRAHDNNLENKSLFKINLVNRFELPKIQNEISRTYNLTQQQILANLDKNPIDELRSQNKIIL